MYVCTKLSKNNKAFKCKKKKNLCISELLAAAGCSQGVSVPHVLKATKRWREEMSAEVRMDWEGDCLFILIMNILSKCQAPVYPGGMRDGFSLISKCSVA